MNENEFDFFCEKCHFNVVNLKNDTIYNSKKNNNNKKIKLWRK